MTTTPGGQGRKGAAAAAKHIGDNDDADVEEVELVSSDVGQHEPAEEEAAPLISQRPARRAANKRAKYTGEAHAGTMVGCTVVHVLSKRLVFSLRRRWKR